MGTEKGLASLQVWHKAMDLAVRICKEIVPTLPPEEKYALANQLRRAAQSIPANIAEGHRRYYYQEGVRFCYIARGSLAETLNHIHLCYRLGYLSEQVLSSYTQEINEVNRMLSGYITFLKNNKRGAAEHDHTVRDSIAEYDLKDSEEPYEDLS